MTQTFQTNRGTEMGSCDTRGSWFQLVICVLVSGIVLFTSITLLDFDNGKKSPSVERAYGVTLSSGEVPSAITPSELTRSIRGKVEIQNEQMQEVEHEVAAMKTFIDDMKIANSLGISQPSLDNYLEQDTPTTSLVTPPQPQPTQ